MSRFEGLMDDDDDSEGFNSASDDASPPGSKFAGLMSDSDDEEEAPAIVQPVISAPPPPPPSSKKNLKKNSKNKGDTEEDELAFLEQLAAQKQKSKELISPSAPKKLELNIAKELNERFYETSFDDSFKLPKNSSNIKFITKRKNWPNLIPLSFTFKEINTSKKNKNKNKNLGNAGLNSNPSSHQLYTISLSDYGKTCKQNFAILQRNLNIDIMLYKLQSDPFDFMLLMGIARYHLFRKEFQEATDLVLRLTFIVQQTIPNKFIFNSTKFQSNTDFYDVVAFIARFAFRRGCNYTSTEIWKFAISVVEKDDPNCFYLCAAVPALFSSDLEFIESVLSKSTIQTESSESGKEDYIISFRGIPISFIPDWTVCQALLYLTEKNDNSKMARVCAIWPDIFTEMKEDETVEITIDNEMPPQLQRVCIALKRRLKPIIMKDNVQDTIHQLEDQIKAEDVKAEKERIFEKWSNLEGDIDVSMIVEEDALPVNPFNN